MTRSGNQVITPDIIFTCLSAVNVHYGLFGELRKRPPLALQIIIGSVIAIHYGKYGELFEDLEDQLMLDNDEIIGDIGDVEDAGIAKNAGNREDTGDAGEVKNVRDTRDAEDARDKEAGRDNEGGEREDAEVGNNERGDGGDQEVGKVGYDRVGDGVGVGRVLEDVEPKKGAQ